MGTKLTNTTSALERMKAFAGTQKKDKEDFDESGKRIIAQYGARAAETALGYPGNLKKSFKESVSALKDFLPDLGSVYALEEKAFGKPEEGSSEEFLMNLPGSQEIREKYTPQFAEMQYGDKDYLEPKGEYEKAGGELVEDLTSFFMPGTRSLNMLTRIGAPVVGNAAKQGLKYLGVEEDTANKAKMGFMLATTLAGQSDPGRYASQQIRQAKDLVPANLTVSFSPLAQRLYNIQQRLQRGLGVPSKARTLQGINELAAQNQNGRISMHSLMDARDNVNEWISEAGGWDVPAPTRDATLRNLNQLKRSIIDTIDTNLNARLPNVAEMYRNGYEAAAVNHQSNAISNFIERHFGRQLASTGAKVLFPALAGGAAVLPKTAGLAAATYPLYKTGQVMYRVSQSPTLATYYQNILSEAAAGNSAAMVKNMDKLDKGLKKLEDKEEKEKPLTLEEFKARIKNKG